MPDKITYYAITNWEKELDKSYGLTRRLETDWGMSDEVLRRDFSWARTGIIMEWEHASFGDELVEISHEQASALLERFREQWRSDPQRADG